MVRNKDVADMGPALYESSLVGTQENTRPRTIIEPFKIKQVEPLKETTPEQRMQFMQAAGWNLFGIAADNVLIDFLTDSGTGSMSSTQWAAMMDGDEAYAGSRSWQHFREAVQDITGFEMIVPAHQGRAAERILFECVDVKGKRVLSNTLFDTTQANCVSNGGIPKNIPVKEALQPSNLHSFKGNIDLEALEGHLVEGAASVACVVITVTNNTGGGQPVSLENLTAASKLCRAHGVPIFLDACRFAENAYFIKLREPAYAHASVPEIVRAMFDLVDGATFSAKKDGLANIGGFLVVRDAELFDRVKQALILTEGYITYGGLAGRDLDAIAVGLREVVQESYLAYRILSTKYLGEGLLKAGIPIVQPPGGHAIYIDAAALLPNIPKEQFPGHAVACAFYIEGGIRMCECGSLMFGESAGLELCRAAIPRRVYTQAHFDYVIEVAAIVARKAHGLRGFRILKQPKVLRHFSAVLQPVPVPNPSNDASKAMQQAVISRDSVQGMSAEDSIDFDTLHTMGMA